MTTWVMRFGYTESYFLANPNFCGAGGSPAFDAGEPPAPLAIAPQSAKIAA